VAASSPLRRLSDVGNDTSRARRRRNVVCVVAVAIVVSPVLIAPAPGVVVAAAAGVAVAAALAALPLGRIDLQRAAVGVGVFSLLIDLVYVGPREPVLFWMPAEMAGLCLLLGRVIRRLPPRRALAVGSLTAAAVFLLPLRFTARMSPLGWSEYVFLAALAVFPAAAAVGVALYLRAVDERRVRAVAQARREQRLEVATELHDFVAHEVTGLVLDVQAAQLDDDHPMRVRTLLERVERAGLRALESMDRTLHTLRSVDGDAPGSPPIRMYGLVDLPDLVGRFGAGGPTRAVVVVEEGVVGVVGQDVERTAYLVVLESLTNVRRHAPGAAEVRVSVARSSTDRLTVVVADDGGSGGVTRERRASGTGLIGLGERVSALGGALAAGPDGRGWQVRCDLPVRPEQPPTRPAG